MVIELKGLNLDGFPLSALAAYGLTRLLNKMGYQAELGFIDAATRPHAYLKFEENAVIRDTESLSEVLAEHVRNTGIEDKGLFRGLTELKELAKSKVPGTSNNEFSLAYINKVPGAKGEVRTIKTPFDTTKGQQRFPKILEDTINLLKKNSTRTKEAFIKALYETVLLVPNDSLSIKFKEPIPRIGWHPSQFRRTADQARIANQENERKTIRLNPAAVFLAWEAIPLYPFVPGTEVPLGFAKEDSILLLFLPTPAKSVNLTFLKTLIALAPSLKDRAPDLPIWRSRRVGSLALGDDYPCFLEAHPARSAI